MSYTSLKDYFEEPNSNNDVVLKFDFTNGGLAVTSILETDIERLELYPPSVRIGITHGKVYDLVKVYVPAGRATGDTVSLFTSGNSPLPTIVRDSIRANFGKAAANSGTGYTVPSIFVGKVLRVDYLTESTGQLGGAVVSLLMYM
jgi:hypothetical protein